MNAELPSGPTADQTDVDDLHLDENLALLVTELTDRLHQGLTVDLHEVCLGHPLCRKTQSLQMNFELSGERLLSPTP